MRDVDRQTTSNSFLPCLLQKFNKDGSLDNKPGLQVSYRLPETSTVVGDADTNLNTTTQTDTNITTKTNANKNADINGDINANSNANISKNTKSLG